MYQRIRDLREDADLRQQDMAEYLQCTRYAILITNREKRYTDGCADTDSTVLQCQR